MTSNPKNLFFVDGAGALLTATMTGLVLAHYAEFIGLPQPVLRGLGLVAAVYAVYSLGHFYFFIPAWRHRLAAIAVANVLYGVVALGLVVYHRTSVSRLGVAYFFIEAVIVGLLARVEWRTSGYRAKRPSASG